MANSRSAFGSVLVTALFTMGFVSGAVAQQPPRSLSEDEFLARVSSTLPELEQYEAEALATQAEVESARALPPLDLSYEREEVFTSGEGVVLKNAVTVGWSLDLSGRRNQRAKSAAHAAQAIRTHGRFEEHRVLTNAVATYKRAAVARLRVESLLATRTPLATLVEQLQRRVREGDASGYDLARFELQLSEHEDRLEEARAEQAVAQTELGGLLALQGQVIANDDLDLPAVMPLRAPGDRRSDLLATDLEERSGIALQSAASRWWIPTLTVSLGYLDTDFGPGTGPGADTASGYSGMLAASIPIFTRGRAERAKANAIVRKAQVKRRILERRIETQIATARTQLASKLEQTMKFKERHLVRASELARKTEAAYQGGEASALELLDAYAREADAELRYIELRYQVGLASLALAKAMGNASAGESR